MLVNGGPVAESHFVDRPAAIAEAFDPNAVGGNTMALSLFGLEKLPHAIHLCQVMQGFDMKDRCTMTPPERAHICLAGKCGLFIWPWLSLTSFEISFHQSDLLRFECTVENAGAVAGRGSDPSPSHCQ